MNNRIGFGALHSLTQRRRERVRFVGLLAMLAVLPVMAVQPEIVADSIAIGQNGALAEITYTLTGEPAVVTINIETNTLANASGDWVSIGGKGTGVLGGEANKVVYTLDRPVKAYWNPVPVFGRKKFEPGAIRVTATAWPTNTPPNYMVADLRHGKFVRYYASTNDLPGGFDNVEYKTSKLLMRKIPAKNVVWWMGSPMRIGDEGWDTTNDVPHKVMLTEDYYAGVYELTIGQLKAADVYDKFFETNFTDYAQSEVADLLPAERLGHHMPELRGLTGYYSGYGNMKNYYGIDSTDYYTYLQRGHEVADNSVIHYLRVRTNLVDLDLPTEAQWEYACRAGSNTELPCNMELTVDNAILFACMNGNSYLHKNLSVAGPMPVGSLKPNDWGLYDTVGNVREMCIELSGVKLSELIDYLPLFKESLAEGWSEGAVTVDPYGVKEWKEARNMVRGWAWREGDKDKNICFINTNISRRYQIKQNDGKPKRYQGYIGVRLFCPVIGNVK